MLLDRIVHGVFALLGAVTVLPTPAVAAIVVDLELVLAVDVSGSVSRVEQDFQRLGLVSAFRDERVIEAIAALPRGLAVAVVAFAGAGRTRTVVGWRHVTGRATLAAVAVEVDAAFPVMFDHCGLTAIGDALAWSLSELATNAYDGTAKIDVSGDGSSSEGQDPAIVRDRAVATGVTINGLAIVNEEWLLADYYRRMVIGGPGAFVLTATDYESFVDAIRLKLLREVAPGPIAASGAN